MTPFPDIPFRIDCAPGFVLPARYTVTMLGLIAGFRPRFVDGSHHGACVSWGGAASATTEEELRLASSRSAQEFLLRKGAYDVRTARDVVVHGRTVLALFFGASSDDAHEDAPDLISTAFFLLSLHEEWSSDVRDEFGRFPVTESLLHKLGALHRPVVSECAHALRAQLIAAGWPVHEGPRWHGREAAFCLTHDIDYLRKLTPGLLWREVVRNFLLDRRTVSFGARASRLLEYLSFIDPARDPYRVSLERLLDREQRNGMRATWFFKSGGEDKRDTRYRLSTPFVRRAFARIAQDGHELGLHPSFRAHIDAGMAGAEKRMLETAAGREVRSVRQHYLRFAYTDTWRMQSGLGFTSGSTLGFAAHEGFRNGTCHPFIPFDLERMEVIPMFELPLHVMDGTLTSYRALDADAAEQALLAQVETVRAHCGAAVVLVHNVCDDPHDFPGWSGIVDRLCGKIAGDGWSAVPLGEAVSGWLEGSACRSALDVLSLIA